MRSRGAKSAKFPKVRAFARIDRKAHPPTKSWLQGATVRALLRAALLYGPMGPASHLHRPGRRYTSPRRRSGRVRNTPRSRAGKSKASKQSQRKLQVFSLKPTHKGRPPGPARFRRTTGRLIHGSTAAPRHKARYIDAAPCHGPDLVFERSPDPSEVSLRLRDRGGTRETAAMTQSHRRNALLRRINGQLKPVG